MHVWTGCTQNHNDLGAGMNKGSMRDFISPQERLNNLSISRFNWYELVAVVIIVVAIGSVQSWL
jgi:hypothetical protein